MQTYEEACQAARSHKSFPALEAKLLAVGGTRVVPSPDPHIGLLIQQGRVIAGKLPKKVRGRRSRCHHNVAFRYLDNPFTYEIATGYGLTAADGLWRQHSWLWDGKHVVETTVDFVRYFGVVLTDEESLNFALNEVLSASPVGRRLCQRIDQRVEAN